VVSLDGLIQHFITGVDIFFHHRAGKGPISASFNHPNDLGAYLIFPLLLVIALLRDKFYAACRRYRAKNNKLQTAGLLFLLCLFTFAMVLTKSRGAWLGMLFGIFLLIFIIYRRVFIWIGISTVLIITLLFLLTPKPMLKSFRLEPIFVQNTYFSRMAIWRDTISMIKDKPVFGHGINTYMREFQKYRDLPWSSNPTYAHNCYLQMAAEMGLFGLMAFLWIIARFFRRSMVLATGYSLQNINGHKPEQIVDYAFLGILAGLLAFLVHSFLDTNLYSLQLNTLFWYMLGFVIASHKIKTDVTA
jgi:O-antigen ligase